LNVFLYLVLMSGIDMENIPTFCHLLLRPPRSFFRRPDKVL
jgi:hypothetical protein